MTNKDILENVYIARLTHDDEANLANFDCINDRECLVAGSRRKAKILRNHSKDMNDFLCNEALDEQDEAYNTTFLLKDKSEHEILAYISLCTDAIKLDRRERKNDEGSGIIGYETFPALKIARLAVHKDAQKNGVGKFMIEFAISKALEMRQNFCGVRFITLDCFKHRLSYYEHVGFERNLAAQSQNEDLPISLRLHIDKYLNQ